MFAEVMINALPDDVELYRDAMWCRSPSLRIQNAIEAEGLIEKVGFCAALTDSRKPGPSLYIAVCGRRDAHTPRNVQKDPECNLSWHIKDDLMRRGKVYYAKLTRGRSTFVSRRLISCFNAIWGVPRRRESAGLSTAARAVLKVLRKEWEMGTRDLREASGIEERVVFNRAIDELQRTMKVIPSDVTYEPSFSYIWSLAEGRFPVELSERITRQDAVQEIALAFLTGAGMTLLGELSRVTGLSRVEAGAGNHDLVSKGHAERIATGIYRLTGLDVRIENLKLEGI